MLHLLDQYTKTQVIQEVPVGNSFAQKDGDEGYDREYWKDKKCFNCEKVGHPSHSCNQPLKSRRGKGKGKGKGKAKKQDDDDTRSVSSKSSSRSSKSSSSSKSSEETALLLKAQMKKVRYTQAVLAAQKKLEDVKESSDISDSDDDDEDEDERISLFQQQFTFLQHSCTHDGKKLCLDNTFLLDSQSTATVIRNKKLVTDIRPSPTTLRMQSNGGILTIKQQATLKGFEAPVWYSPKALGNVLALKDVKQKYRVTYDSDDSMFVVHREHTGKPNMHFKEHKSGLHGWKPGVPNEGNVRQAIPGVTAANVSIPGVEAQIPGVPGVPPLDDEAASTRTTRVRFQKKVAYAPTTIGSRKPKVAQVNEWLLVGPSKRRQKKVVTKRVDMLSRSKSSPQECVRVRGNRVDSTNRRSIAVGGL
jgi:hypothetical protein